MTPLWTFHERRVARARGRLATYEELQRHIWPDVFVTLNSLAQCFTAIRRTLGRDALEGKPRRCPPRLLACFPASP